MEVENRLRIRSEHDSEKAFIRFLNRSGRNVEVIWINYTGLYVKYKNLANHQYVDVNTFKTHPWLALDAVTKDRMLINQAYVYFPQANESRRILAAITLPLYSLRYRALIEVRNYLKNVKDVDSLGLPYKLSEDLKNAITLRNCCLIEPLCIT